MVIYSWIVIKKESSNALKIDWDKLAKDNEKYKDEFRSRVPDK